MRMKNRCSQGADSLLAWCSPARPQPHLWAERLCNSRSVLHRQSPHRPTTLDKPLPEQLPLHTTGPDSCNTTGPASARAAPLHPTLKDRLAASQVHRRQKVRPQNVWWRKVRNTQKVQGTKSRLQKVGKKRSGLKRSARSGIQKVQGTEVVGYKIQEEKVQMQKVLFMEASCAVIASSLWSVSALPACRALQQFMKEVEKVPLVRIETTYFRLGSPRKKQIYIFCCRQFPTGKTRSRLCILNK